MVAEQPQWIPRQQKGTAARLSAADKGKSPVVSGAAAGSKSSQAGEEKAKKGPKWLKLGAK